MNVGGLTTDFVKDKRIMVGEQLGLIRCEISFTYVPSGGSIPFVHSHKLNEELYIILSGMREFMVDNEEVVIEEGTIICGAPEGELALKAQGEQYEKK